MNSIDGSLLVQLLLQMPFSSRASIVRVSRQWKAVVSSRGFAELRAARGLLEFAAIVNVQDAKVWALRESHVANVTWRCLPRLPAVYSDSRLVACGADLWLIGSIYHEPGYPEVLHFSCAHNSWRAGPSMQHARTDFACGAVGHKIIVAGGDVRVGSVEVLDVAQEAWSGAPALLCNVSGAASAALHDTLWVFGGYSVCNDDIRDVVQVYDPEMLGWCGMTALQPGRAFASALAVNERLWIIGGKTGEKLFQHSAVMAEIAIYDPATDGWEEGPSLPQPLHSCSSVVLGRKLMVFGGKGEDPLQLAVLRPVLVLDVSGGPSSWSSLLPLPAADPARDAASQYARDVSADVLAAKILLG